MNVNQFEPYIKSEYKEALKRENVKYILCMNQIRKIANGVGGPYVEAFCDATCATAALVHKIHIVFSLGYFTVEDEVLGTEVERTKLYREITEYISLVEAGIDSFMETHPIKAITEGGADDEER